MVMNELLNLSKIISYQIIFKNLRILPNFRKSLLQKIIDKTLQFLLQRGFEKFLFWQVLEISSPSDL